MPLRAFVRWMCRVGVITACALGVSPAPASAQAPCEAEPTDMSISYGVQVICATSAGGDNDIFRFTGVAGDRVLVEALKVGGVPNYNTRIQLVGPNGVQVGATFNPARIDTLLLLSGTYTIVVVDVNLFYAGDFGLTVTCTSGSCLDQPPIPPQPAPERNVACEPEPTDMFPFLGTRVNCSIDPGADNDVYRFEGREGDRVLIEVTKLGGEANFNTRIQVWAPDGTQVAATFNPARADLQLTQTGVFTAVVTDVNFAYIGTYAFTATCTGGPCLALRSVPTATLSLTGCTVCSAGDSFSLQVHWQNLGPQRVAEVKLALRVPDGTAYSILANKHTEFTFPASFDSSGGLLSFTWPAGLPPGQWTAEATLLGPIAGDTFHRDVKVFTVSP